MPPGESREARFDRLKRQLQESILRDYPNPERKGCPGEAVLRRLAGAAVDELVDTDPHWHHVTHCAECYQEFLSFNDAIRERVKARKARFTWAAAVLVAIAVIVVTVSVGKRILGPTRPQNAELAYATETIDIPSMVRSGNADDSKPIVLRRRPLNLTVNLPIGSKAGRYELELKKGNQTLLSTSAEAQLLNGTTSFTAKVDLSGFGPGDYSLYVRQLSFDWNWYPVVIR